VSMVPTAYRKLGHRARFVKWAIILCRLRICRVTVRGYALALRGTFWTLCIVADTLQEDPLNEARQRRARDSASG